VVPLMSMSFMVLRELININNEGENDCKGQVLGILFKGVFVIYGCYFRGIMVMYKDRISVLHLN